MEAGSPEALDRARLGLMMAGHREGAGAVDVAA
jgi:hypothetical protein